MCSRAFPSWPLSNPFQWNPKLPCPQGGICHSTVSTRKERWRGSEEAGKHRKQMISKVKQKENVEEPPVQLFEVNQGLV